MPGTIESFFVLAFATDSRDQAIPAFEPLQVASESEALSRSKALSERYDGVIAWKRHAETAIGEIGPPETIVRYGRIGDYD